MTALLGRHLPVQIEGVSKTYGAVTAVDRVTLAVDQGEFVTLLGPSGSGKTTLLMMLAGFVQPTAGDILVGGQSIKHLPPHKRNIGMVFQNYALFPHLSVFDNIAFPLKLRRLPGAEIESRVGEALDLVRLQGLGRRRIHELSGGQSQRVALARAIVFEPSIMLMDEPLSALDKRLRDQMQVEIRRLHEALGVTTIYVTHDQREALTLSDRIAVIDRGRLMQFDVPRTVYDHPANAFVAEFIGESTLLPVLVISGIATAEGTPVITPYPVPSTGEPLSLVLRPEKLHLAVGNQKDGDTNYLQGTLLRAMFQGESILYTVRLANGTEIMVRDLGREGGGVYRVGQAVRIAFHRDDALVIPGRQP
ncbi:MAG: ABC transporter ATP-binding protein [Proteobacteria bacterium]|nr:ABC transporter ATP-binding protein [Pseudomonadota bacterium]MBI3500137.1 ABC transporter ATP-binding protein [Pseudomonadota bacterium]